MLKQLLLLINFFILNSALCEPNLSITGINTYSIIISNKNRAISSQNYQLSVESIVNQSTSISINNMESVTAFDWKLILSSTNRSSMMLTFTNADKNWVSLGCIVWSVGNVQILSGYHTIQSPLMIQTQSYHLKLNQPIPHQISSVALVFLNGVKTHSSTTLNLSIEAFRVFNQSVYINISNYNNQTINQIHISYVVFSPIQSHFISYGDIIAVKASNLLNYADISEGVPETPYKMFGISGISSHSQLQLLDFQISVTSDYYMLMKTKNLSLLVTYFYFVSSNFSCQNCHLSTVSGNTCIDSCPNGTIMNEFNHMYFCKGCPSQLNLVMDDKLKQCKCKIGYEFNDNKICTPLMKEVTFSSKIEQTKINNPVDPKENMNMTLFNEANKKIIQIGGTSDKIEINQPAITTNQKQTNSNQYFSILQTNITNKTSIINTNNQNDKPTNSSTQNITIIPSTVIVSNSTQNKIQNSSNLTETQTSTIQGSIQPNKGKTQSPNQTYKSSDQSTTINTIPNVTSVLNPIAHSQVNSSNCSQIKNSEFTLGSCVCLSGYINVSNMCISTTCLPQETFDFRFNSCICNSGYTRLNGKCVSCKQNGTFLGNQTCYYSLPLSSGCQLNYTQSNNYCLLCSAINQHIFLNQVCINCMNGLIYDGFVCICPKGSRLIKGVCVSLLCGNGHIDSGQSCDDGNILNDDGCSSQCLIESLYYCVGVPSVCRRWLCGDGVINGGQQCDDKNKLSGDGCSDLCLLQSGFTCLGVPSSCFPVVTGNITLISININTNNVLVSFRIDDTTADGKDNIPSSQIQIKFLNATIGGTYYCQKTKGNSTFECLVIFPYGVSNNFSYLLISYRYQGKQGSLIVEVSGLNAVLSSRNRKL